MFTFLFIFAQNTSVLSLPVMLEDFVVNNVSFSSTHSQLLLLCVSVIVYTPSFINWLIFASIVLKQMLFLSCPENHELSKHKKCSSDMICLYFKNLLFYSLMWSSQLPYSWPDNMLLSFTYIYIERSRFFRYGIEVTTTVLKKLQILIYVPLKDILRWVVNYPKGVTSQCSRLLQWR